MLWTSEEKKEIRKQVKNNVPLKEIHIDNRSSTQIRYQIYRLCLFVLKWKRKELAFLKRSIKEGKKIEEIEIQGRSKAAIRNKAIRSGIWKPKKHVLQKWTMCEVAQLKHLVLDRGYKVNQLIFNGYFPDRTKDSIAQQIRRLGLKKK